MKKYTIVYSYTGDMGFPKEAIDHVSASSRAKAEQVFLKKHDDCSIVAVFKGKLVEAVDE